ncbi:MAG TPA: hypothetical protein VG733_13440 [Chthoniobacteraceae bacterium]|nr:hypothetical protein [Chthoniobacteraceae bacterium]
MKSRMLFFSLGLLLAGLCAGGFLLWDAKHNYYWKQKTEEPFATAPAPGRFPSADDLLGTWHGTESGGILYTITRHSDGTFSEVLDSSKASYPWDPAVIKSSGHWSVDNSRYVYYYTTSTKPTFVGQGPWIRDIDLKNPKELSYREEEGSEVTEHKD